jgi:hypothetical protein
MYSALQLDQDSFSGSNYSTSQFKESGLQADHSSYRPVSRAGNRHFLTPNQVSC